MRFIKKILPKLKIDQLDPLSYHPFQEAGKSGSLLGLCVAGLFFVIWVVFVAVFFARLISSDTNIQMVQSPWDAEGTYFLPNVGINFMEEYEPLFNRSWFKFGFTSYVIRNQDNFNREKKVYEGKPCLVGSGISAFYPDVTLEIDPSTGVAGWPKMQGLYTDPIYRYVKIHIERWDPATYDGGVCEDAAVIDNYFFSTTGPDRRLNLWYENAINEDVIVWNNILVTFGGQGTTRTAHEVYFTPITVTDKHSMSVVVPDTVYEYLQYDEVDIRSDQFWSEYASFYLRMSQATIQITRTPAQIIDFLKNVGGMFTMLMITLGFLGRILNRMLYKKRLRHYDPNKDLGTSTVGQRRWDNLFYKFSKDAVKQGDARALAAALGVASSAVVNAARMEAYSGVSGSDDVIEDDGMEISSSSYASHSLNSTLPSRSSFRSSSC